MAESRGATLYYRERLGCLIAFGQELRTVSLDLRHFCIEVGDEPVYSRALLYLKLYFTHGFPPSEICYGCYLPSFGRPCRTALWRGCPGCAPVCYFGISRCLISAACKRLIFPPRARGAARLSPRCWRRAPDPWRSRLRLQPPP